MTVHRLIPVVVLAALARCQPVSALADAALAAPLRKASDAIMVAMATQDLSIARPDRPDASITPKANC